MKNLTQYFLSLPWDGSDRRKLFHIFLTLFLSILLVFLILTATAPDRTYRKMHTAVYADSAFIQGFSRLPQTPSIDSLLKKKAFFEAQLNMVTSDSIALVINLNDSIVNLLIKGVTIHSSKIPEFRIDPILKKLQIPVYYKFFSHSISVVDDYCSIVKEPIIIRHAPKDTLEAAQSVYFPDTLKKDPAFIVLHTDIGLEVNIEQNEKAGMAIKRIHSEFLFRKKYRDMIANVKQILKFRKPEYSPAIYIELSGDDVRTIYRAIPDNAQIVLMY